MRFIFCLLALVIRPSPIDSSVTADGGGRYEIMKAYVAGRDQQGWWHGLEFCLFVYIMALKSCKYDDLMNMIIE